MKNLNKNDIRHMTEADLRRTRFEDYVKSLVESFPDLDYSQLAVASGLSQYDIRRALGLIQ